MATILITDTDNWIINKWFNYLLGFQPSFWWILIKKNSVTIFLDNRYFNISKAIDKNKIIEKTNKSYVHFKKIEWNLVENILIECNLSSSLKLEERLTLKYFTQINEKSNLWIYINPKKTEIIENYFKKKRKIKNQKELLNIKKAIDIIEKVFNEIEKLNNGWKIIWNTENDIRKIIIKNIIELWWTWESFDSIVAFWKNSAIPHHQTWNTIIWNWPLLIDMWALYNWYCSDFTRTIWVWKKNEDFVLFKKIFNIVKTAHDEAQKNIQAWICASELDKIARDYIVANWYWGFFTHSTWHWVWLNIHESPFLNEKSDEIIQSWMVFTIEPWIYLEWEFWVRHENIHFI
jgi:Xaa-Pro aminopeptidase/Xaa-Pro dipeptidase